MSPGITITPGIGGTKKSCDADAWSSVNEKPTTLRFGMRAWICSVSGMIVFSDCSCGTSTVLRSTVVGDTSASAPTVGSNTGKATLICDPSPMAKAAVKL